MLLRDSVHFLLTRLHSFGLLFVSDEDGYSSQNGTWIRHSLMHHKINFRSNMLTNIVTTNTLLARKRSANERFFGMF